MKFKKGDYVRYATPELINHYATKFSKNNYNPTIARAFFIFIEYNSSDEPRYCRVVDIYGTRWRPLEIELDLFCLADDLNSI